MSSSGIKKNFFFATNGTLFRKDQLEFLRLFAMHTWALGGAAGERCGAGKPKSRLGIIKMNYK